MSVTMMTYDDYGDAWTSMALSQRSRPRHQANDKTSNLTDELGESLLTLHFNRSEADGPTKIVAVTKEPSES